MVGFNPDGSIRIPSHMTKKKDAEDRRMRVGRCMKVVKEVVYDKAPKKCALHLKLSSAITDGKFVVGIYDLFKKQADTPTSLEKVEDREFRVDIGTDFKRCSDCDSLLRRYREYLEGNLIEDVGTCPRKKREFCYEDHFD